jgi:hypothetical protein
MSKDALYCHIFVGKKFSTTSNPLNTAFYMSSPVGFAEKDRNFGILCSWGPSECHSTLSLGKKFSERVEGCCGALSFSGFIVS